MDKESYNKLSSIILDSALAVHREMGPGLLESIYQHCMVRELRLRGIKISDNGYDPIGLQGAYIEQGLCNRYPC